MEKQFNEIKAAYADFSRELLKNGKLPIKDTGIGYWSIAVCDEIFALFNRMNLSQYHSFVDLGSGDGRVTLIASLFTKAHGIEFDPELHAKSMEMKDKLGLDAQFYHGDFLKQDLSNYALLFIHPDQHINKKLEGKLLREMNGKLLVHGPLYHPSTLKKTNVHDVFGMLSSEWIKP